MADVTFRRGVEANLPTSGMATEGCVYQSTDTGNMYVGSSQGTLIPVNRSPYYGTCTTEASTNAKVVTLDVDNDNFTMKAGVMISVLFSNTNTAASPTLNVNGKGAVSVKVYGTTNVSASPRSWEAGEVVTFVHNGTNWLMVGRKVQSDWNQTDTAAADFIKNKPTNVSAFTNDADYITTNDLVAGTDLEIVSYPQRLPNGYEELEYIESSGTQYIVPNVLAKKGIRLECEAQGKGDKGLVFSFDQDYSGSLVADSGSKFYMSGLSASTSTQNSLDRKKITMSCDIIDGYRITQGTIGDQSSTPYTSSRQYNYFHIFKGFNWNSENSFWSGRIFYFKFWLDDDIIRDLIPAKRLSDNKIGLYDIVNNVFYTNQGTGEFLSGASVLTDNVIINFTNDTGYITSADLAEVATSGSYNDLSDTPTIPNDNNLVHKTGNETIGGTKTFNNNVVLGSSANLVLGSAQDEGVYIEANSSSGGQQALIFSSLDDDSAVRLENVAAPTANTDAANKQYVDDAVGNTYVSLNGVADTYGIQQQSLCAFAFTAYPTAMAMTSFTTSGGTGSKTPITNRWFPIGCKIYYHDGGTQFTGSFTSKKFYSTYNGVNARYSAVTGTNVSLSSGKAVYLMVEASANGLWKPFYKSGETNEIIVTDTISAGHFYIYLGRAVGSTGYMFQLEDNNPLYACVMDGSGTHLVDWATYNSSRTPYLVKNIQLFPSSQFPIGGNPIIGNTGIYSRELYLDSSYLEGVYKVTLQLHAWWDYPTGTLDTPQPLSVIVNHNTNDKIAGGTFVIPVIESPNDSNYEMGTLVVNLVGFVTFTSAQTINDYIEVKVQGAKGINLGGEHPLWGGNEGDVEYNDGLILERVDWYNPT